MYPETMVLPFRQIYNTTNSFPSFEADSEIAPILRVDVFVYRPTGGACCNSQPSLAEVWTSGNDLDVYAPAIQDKVKLNTLGILEGGFEFYDWLMELLPGGYNASVQFTMMRDNAPVTIPMFELKFEVDLT